MGAKRAAGTVIATAALAALPVLMRPAWSQSAPQADATLLRPTLQSSPQTSVFTKPAVTTATPDELPPGQLPIFGDDPAGTTGFDSSNARKKRAIAQSSGAAATTTNNNPPPPYDPSAVAPARQPQSHNATRHGVAQTAPAPVVLAPAPTDLPPLQGVDPALAIPRNLLRRPVIDDKPFDPTGIALGAFLVKPAIEFSTGYDTNPSRAPQPGGSLVGIVAPELQAASNWERHELTVNLRGSFTTYGSSPVNDRPALDGRVDGRVDVTRTTRIDLEARSLVGTDNPGSPNIQAGIIRLPVYADLGGTIGFGQRFNRVDFSVKEGLDRTTYQRSSFTDGEVASNDDRNFDQYLTQLRAGYDLMPGVAPFAEVDVDKRVHDLVFDSFGFARDSDGRAAKLGSTFTLTPILTGQAAIGYTWRTYRDPTLAPLAGATFDASLLWLASALTTVKLTAITVANETTVPGVSGVFTHEVDAEVDHAFRRWLDIALKFTYARDDYEGSVREDNRYSAGTALTYKLNREMWLRGELRRDWLASNLPGNNYAAYVALLTLRLQR